MFSKFIIPVIAIGLAIVGSKYLYSVYYGGKNNGDSDKEIQIVQDEQLDDSIIVNQIENDDEEELDINDIAFILDVNDDEFDLDNFNRAIARHQQQQQQQQQEEEELERDGQLELKDNLAIVSQDLEEPSTLEPSSSSSSLESSSSSSLAGEGQLIGQAFIHDGITFFILKRQSTLEDEDENIYGYMKDQLYYFEGFLICGEVNGQPLNYAFNIKFNQYIPIEVMEDYIISKARMAFLNPELIPAFEQMIFIDYGVEWDLEYMLNNLNDVLDKAENQ